MLNKVNTPFISSFLFATNIYHLSYKHNSIYKKSFIYLTGSSLLYHSSRHIKLYYYIDQLGVYNIIYQGGYEYYKYLYRDRKNIYTISSIFNLSSFFSVLWLYGYGYYTKQYAFDTNGYDKIYHSLIHIITSVCHHSITNTII
mgnify:CR=1 FL=1|jgi:hypothetical protein